MKIGNLIIEKQKNVIWFYIKGRINRSISWQYCPNWEKPIYSIRTNGARYGIKDDTCFDLNIHVGRFAFSYTNWQYNSHLQ